MKFSVKMDRKLDENGEVSGGPMYYLREWIKF